MESQPLFTGERFSTEKDSRKVQGPGSEGASRLLPLCLHFRVACALRYVPGTSDDEKTTTKLEIAQQRREGQDRENLRRFR